MDAETINLILRCLQVLVIPVAIWVWRRFASLDAEITGLRERLSTAEARLKDAPSTKSLHELSLSVERMSGNLKALGERMGGMDRVVERMDRILSRQEEFLLNNGGK